MSKTKRILVMLMCLAIGIGMLSGCAPGKSLSTSTSKDIPTLVWYQIGDEPKNLKEGVSAINEYIAEKIGMKIDIKFFGWGDYDTKTNNILNTGGDFDIMFINERRYISNATSGKFLKLDTYLDGVGADLKKFIPETLWKGATVKDGIYSVPTYKDFAKSQYFSYDKAMVDKYKLDIDSVKSLADLEPLLKIIKEGEEAATGDKVYPFPLAKEGYGAYDTYYDNFVRYDDKAGKVVNYFEAEEVMNDFKTLKSWVEKGYINQSASVDDEPPKYRHVFSFQAFEGAEINVGADRGYEMVMRPYTETVASTMSILGSVNAISVNTKYKEEAVKFLQLINTDAKVRNILAYGIEGKQWSKNDDETITRVEDHGWSAASYSQATFMNLYPVSPNTPDQYTRLKTQMDKAIGHVLLGFSFDDTDVSDQYSEINSLVLTKKAEFATGVYEGTTEAHMAAFVAELKAAGLEEVMAETQKQVDAFLGN